MNAAHTGSVNNGQTTAIAYDKADNRTSYAVTNATISIASASANEGSPLTFTVTRNGSTASTASASWATSNDTAIAGTNYTASSGTVSFAAGVTTATITVPTIHDNLTTPNLTMKVTLSSPSSGVLLGNSVGTGTINNTDTTATLSIAAASANEGSPLIFTVARAGNTAPAVSASWATSNGTAAAGTNYTASSGTVSFAANVTTATLTVPTIDDHIITTNLGMTVTLSAPSSGAVLGTASASGTINNIDTTTGWTSSLTTGAYQYCYGLACQTWHGYWQSVMGSMSNLTFHGYTIVRLYSTSGFVVLAMTGSSAPPNSGWTSIVIPGVGTLLHSAASYSSSSGQSVWNWMNSAPATDGTVVIQ